MTKVGITLININVYDSPDNSSYKLKHRQNGIIDNTLDDLLEFISSTVTGEIMLMGDFNARTRNLNFELIEEENFDSKSPRFIKSKHTAPGRTSKDNV